MCALTKTKYIESVIMYIYANVHKNLPVSRREERKRSITPAVVAAIYAFLKQWVDLCCLVGYFHINEVLQCPNRYESRKQRFTLRQTIVEPSNSIENTIMPRFFSPAPVE